MPMIARLIGYIDSIIERDPSPRSRLEVLTYPGLWAYAWHKLAHRLYEKRLFLLARWINHHARRRTAIDIHPGATIGRRLFIDHGFTVVGETAEIGDNVTIYQCVTLGGTNPADGVAGKRHPTIGDDVIIGSGAQILGPITVGKGARIGANAVVTRDVAPGAVMVGIPAKPTLMDADKKPRGFVPYGTPCADAHDPATQKLEIMRCELEELHKALDALIAERDGSADEAARGSNRA